MRVQASVKELPNWYCLIGIASKQSTDRNGKARFALCKANLAKAMLLPASKLYLSVLNEREQVDDGIMNPSPAFNCRAVRQFLDHESKSRLCRNQSAHVHRAVHTKFSRLCEVILQFI